MKDNTAQQVVSTCLVTMLTDVVCFETIWPELYSTHFCMVLFLSPIHAKPFVSNLLSVVLCHCAVLCYVLIYTFATFR